MHCLDSDVLHDSVVFIGSWETPTRLNPADARYISSTSILDSSRREKLTFTGGFRSHWIQFTDSLIIKALSSLPLNTDLVSPFLYLILFIAHLVAFIGHLVSFKAWFSSFLSDLASSGYPTSVCCDLATEEGLAVEEGPGSEGALSREGAALLHTLSCCLDLDDAPARDRANQHQGSVLAIFTVVDRKSPRWCIPSRPLQLLTHLLQVDIRPRFAAT